ncbi:exodeoxyribonuclease VII small subunit [Kiloniella antarctica]|uniref:Exodeoxyribonuclease 7 small subunit n=1 Tax=Kiloniella antarctica TaxID=1550907 RepID=A0ABW5BN60_9PROT
MTENSKAVDNAAAIQAMSFEAALAELKMIVERLEQGEGKLDEAIDAYDRGAKLKAHCESKLREAQEKIEKITIGPDGEPRTEPFDVA